MKALIVLFAVTAALGVTGLTIVAAEKTVPGQDLYRNHCKHCHEANSPNGEYTPMTLIQDQWKRFFKDKYEAKHRDVVDQKHEGKKVLDVITPEILEKIKKFAIDHAADSEHPMTCGGH
ncbi:MAG TPA: hypothetical protein VEL51_17850 [Vicinamibacterales bacterium]|nr:hypothetical protein [Vicinamibacterales bacterium]